MKIGSVEHKELFCRSFLESYIDYEPEYLPWPDLDDQNVSPFKFPKTMSKYDPRLLQPQLLPRLANIALHTLQLTPKRKLQNIESASA